MLVWLTTRCGRVLDEPRGTEPSERKPCPACGSLARVFEVSGSAIVGGSASMALAKIHEELQRHEFGLPPRSMRASAESHEYAQGPPRLSHSPGTADCGVSHRRRALGA